MPNAPTSTAWRRVAPAYLESMNAPARTESKLRALLDGDIKALFDHMRKGAGRALTRPQVRKFERAQLEERLASDKHETEIALGAFDQLEGEIELRRKEIEVLEGRHRSFVHDAIIERAEALGAVYVAQITALRRTIAELRGIATVVEGRRSFSPSFSAEVDVRLPTFNIPGVPGYRGEAVQAYAPMQPSIKVTATDADNAAGPWRALATLGPRTRAPSRPSCRRSTPRMNKCRCLATAAKPTTRVTTTMPMIDWISAASIGGRVTAAGEHSPPNVAMPPGIAKALRKADIRPPATGTQLSVADVDASLPPPAWAWASAWR